MSASVITERMPRLFFMLMAPLLTELLSGNMPLSILFQPTILIGLATIVYGFPLLLAWDWRLERRLNLFGVLVAGCAYGVFNEGVMAKTLFAESHLPVPFFDGYLRWGGINWAWAAPMVLWHAFHAILFPLLFGEWLFPGIAGRYFHDQKKFKIRLSVIAVISGVMWFLPRADAPAVSPIFWLVAAGVIALLLIIARRLTSAPMSRGGGSAGYFIAGVILSAGYFVAPCILAATHQPAWVYGGYWLLLASAAILGRRFIHSIGFRSWLLLACGGELFFGCFGTVARVQRGEIVGASLNGLLAAVFLGIAIFLKLRWNRQCTKSDLSYMPVSAGNAYLRSE